MKTLLLIIALFLTVQVYSQSDTKEKVKSEYIVNDKVVIQVGMFICSGVILKAVKARSTVVYLVRFEVLYCIKKDNRIPVPPMYNEKWCYKSDFK
jgi:hypothetical protein